MPPDPAPDTAHSRDAASAMSQGIRRDSPRAIPQARWPAAVLRALGAVARDSWVDALVSRYVFAPPQALPAPQASPTPGEVWIRIRSTPRAGKKAALHGVWHPHANPHAPALLFLHGARADLSRCAERIRHMSELGFSVLAIDYRGFGRSEPMPPSELTAYEDARAAWRWLAQRCPDTPRYIAGHSLGGAIAIHLAAQVRDAAGLIVDSSFTCLADVMQHLHWGWPSVIRRITRRFDSARMIALVRAPVLVVHGEQDEWIPPSLGRALWERVTAPKCFVLIHGGSHHNTHAVGQRHYREALRELFGLQG